MKQTMKQLAALQRELTTLAAQRSELCLRIGTIYIEGGRSEESFDAAYALFEEAFQPLLDDIDLHQRSIARLTPQAPRHSVNGLRYSRVRRVN